MRRAHGVSVVELIRHGRIGPMRGSRQAHEIEQAADARSHGESRKNGGRENRDGRTGTPGGSGKAEDQGDQSCTDGLPEQSSSRLDGTGAAASFARRADDDGSVIWRLEKPEPEPADGHPPNDIRGTRISRQCCDQNKAKSQRAEANPAEDAGRIAVCKSTRDRRDHRNHDRPGGLQEARLDLRATKRILRVEGQGNKTIPWEIKVEIEATTESVNTGILNKSTGSSGKLSEPCRRTSR